MKTNKPLMSGNNILSRFFEYPVENSAVMDDQDQEDADKLRLHNQHNTKLRDKSVLDRVISTSIIEIIS